MKFIVENSGKLNIIFLHGWGADYTSFYFLKDMLKKYTLHFANLDGFGGEPAPLDSTIPGYANRLHNYIITNNLKNVILVGHSFGGRIALQYASEHVLKGLVLVDSAGLKPKFSLKKIIKIKKYKFVKWQVKHGLKPHYMLNNYGSDDYKNCPSNLKKVLINSVNYHQNNLLKYINIKTLIVWGENDLDTPLYMAKQLNFNIKNSKLVILENAGHFSFLNKPLLFYKYLLNFINSI